MVSQDDPAIGRNSIAKPLNPLHQEEHHRRVVVLAAAILTAIEEVPDWVETNDVGRGAWKILSDCVGDEPHAFFI